MIGKLKFRSITRQQDSNGIVISFIQMQQWFNMSEKWLRQGGAIGNKKKLWVNVKRADNLACTLPKPIQGSSKLTCMKLRYCMDRNHFFKQQCKPIRKTLIIMYTWLWKWFDELFYKGLSETFLVYRQDSPPYLLIWYFNLQNIHV